MRDDDMINERTTPTSPDGRTDEGASPERESTYGEQRPGGTRRRGLRNLTPRTGRARLALATGAACCLGLVAVIEVRAATHEPAPPTDRSASSADLVERAEEQPASRALARTPAPSASPAPPTASPSPSRPAATTPAPKKTPTKKPTPRKPVDPAPVAGLTTAQMKNATVIVRTGRAMGVPRRGLVVAVATAMQESNLYNLASGVVPESQNLPNQGLGWDHDSVGLFQQRASMGWGTVEDLMNPAYATRQFLTALLAVPGWQQMRLTDAAQAVQISGFPEAYAQHESRATVIVEAIVPSGV
ncbi:peptidase M23 [Micromonospora cathayae]|uniref:Peptidase M23 n=1 Tax=Micromonospora cathayae TaxID=3028804 RepID=A0ABY8A1A7_9ACTN|nr:peptidase M23 [Micromonospora sp. HUAS 3]WDZ87899.1 peptidase M23 [Micromonospora sp. HUAS 3]